MAATVDREAVWSAGRVQWYAAVPGTRIYRHTLVAVEAAGLLRPLADTAGLEYVGVAGQAVYLGANGRCPVLHRGEGRFRFSGSPSQDDVGLIAYAVDDETVTADRNAVEYGYAVGRIAGLEPDGLVRVGISGFAAVSVGQFMAGFRRHFTVGPHEITVDVSTEYRFGLTLPESFGEATFAAELVCEDPDVAEKVVVRPCSSRRAANRAEWTVYAPADTPGASGGAVTFEVSVHLAGEGWYGPVSGILPAWMVPSEVSL
jgi:hypothetical protein